MFYWVTKIKRKQVDLTPPKKAVEVQIWPKTLEQPKVEAPRISKYIQRFDENLTKFEWTDLKELKEEYKALGWKPNNFLSDRNVLIYLISRLQIQHEW